MPEVAGTSVRRSDVVAAQRERPPFGRRTFRADDPPVRVGITGTGDDLLLLGWTASDLARERGAGARLFGRLGIRPEMRVANALPGALATPGALLVGDVNEEIGALDVPLGTIDGDAAAAAAWELIDRVEANVLVLAPAGAAALLARRPAAARPWWQGIVWLRVPGDGGVAARPGDFGGWQREWLAVPEVSCFAAGTCERGAFHADEAVTLAVQHGELVVTARDGDAVAYATGARAREVASCACGAGPAVELT